jgi:hypothetical protein
MLWEVTILPPLSSINAEKRWQILSHEWATRESNLHAEMHLLCLKKEI